MRKTGAASISRSIGMRPLLPAATFFAAGIAMAELAGIPAGLSPYPLLAASLVLSALALAASHKIPGTAFVLSLTAMACAGGGLALLQASPQTPHDRVWSLLQKISSSGGISPPGSRSDEGAPGIMRASNASHFSNSSKTSTSVSAVLEGHIVSAPSFRDGKTTFRLNVFRVLNESADPGGNSIQGNAASEASFPASVEKSPDQPPAAADFSRFLHGISALKSDQGTESSEDFQAAEVSSPGRSAETSEWIPLRFSLRMSMRGDPPLFRGDAIRVRAKIRKLESPKNFGAADMRKALAPYGISLTGNVIGNQAAVFGRPPFWASLARRHRRRFDETARLTFGSGPEADLVRSLGLGDRSGLEDESGRSMADDFRASGLAHLFSVSGLHVGIVAVSAARILRRILSRIEHAALRFETGRAAAVMTLPVTWLYVFLTGAAVPSVRAGLMATAAGLARICFRDGDPESALALSCAVILALDPASLISPSFQLSFAAAAGLMLLAGPMQETVRARIPWNQTTAHGSATGEISEEVTDTVAEREAVSGLAADPSLRTRMEDAAKSGRASPQIFFHVAEKVRNLGMNLSEIWHIFFSERFWPVLAAARKKTSEKAYSLAGSLAAFALSNAAAAFAATLATAPIALLIFRQFSFVTLAANVAALPLGSLLTALSALAAFLLFVSPDFAAAVLSAAPPLAQFLVTLVSAMASIPMASVETSPSAPSSAAAVYLAEASFFLLLKTPFKQTARRLLFAACISAALSFSAGNYPGSSAEADSGQPKLQVIALSVGQGDCFLIRLPDGRDVLLDGGGELDGRRNAKWRVGDRVVVPSLKSLGVFRLDIVIMSHPHPDHALGLLDVIRQLPVGEIWMPDGAQDAALTHAIFQASGAFQAVSPRIRFLSRGMTESAGNTSIEFLHPPAAPHEFRENDLSLVFRLTFGKISFLFTGDLETRGENEVLRWIRQRRPAAFPPETQNGAGMRSIRSTVLKVGHHGSASSSSWEFLQAVRPEQALISCGFENQFGFPAPGVLKRLSDAGVKIHRTDTSGAIVMETDGTKISVSRPFETEAPP